MNRAMPLHGLSAMALSLALLAGCLGGGGGGGGGSDETPVEDPADPQVRLLGVTVVGTSSEPCTATAEIEYGEGPIEAYEQDGRPTHWAFTAFWSDSSDTSTRIRLVDSAGNERAYEMHISRP